MRCNEKIRCGNATLFRVACPNCRAINLSGENIILCVECKMKFEAKTDRVRVLINKKQRNRIKAATKRRIIEQQKNRCFWCGTNLNGYYILRGRMNKTRTHFDHVVPFVYQQNDSEENLVASCNICNGIKSCLVFESNEACRHYILKKRQKLISNEDLI